MRIGIGNDHSALELKAEIIEFLKEKGHEVVDYGTKLRKAVITLFMEKSLEERLFQKRLIVVF